MKPDANSHTVAPLAELRAIEHRIEDAVDHAVHRAERSIALRFGLGAVRWLRRALKVIATAVLVTGFAFGLTVLALRYWLLPRIDDYRPWLQQELSRLLGSDVRIGHIEAGWQGLQPQLAVSDLRLLDANGRDVLVLPQVDAVLSWTSVAAAGLRLQDLIVQGPALEVRRNADGTFVIAGFALASGPAGDGALMKNVLAQPHVSIRGARLRYVDVTADGEHSVEFSDVAFEYRRGVLGNRFALRAAPPAALGGTLDVRGEFSTPWGEAQADLTRWRGRLFLQGEALDLVQLARLSRALPAPAQLVRARGAVRGWLDFDALRISRLTVDLALADVQARLGEQVEAIALDRLAGRLTMRAWGESAAGAEGGEEWQLTDLALSGPDLKLPPTQLSLRLTRAQAQQAARGRLEADQLSLDTITTLGTHLPLPPPLRQLLARYGLRGQLTSLRYAWEGELQAPQRYAMRSEFGALSAVAEDASPRATPAGRPRPGRPGFTNLSGRVEFDESGGDVRIDASDVTLDLRGVLPQPIAWRSFAARANFRLTPAFELRIDEFSASNADVELTAAGRYQRGGKGPGLIDASGRIKRAAVAQIHNYLPLITGARTRAWLLAALVAGEAHDGTFDLKGDLADFPFTRAGSGEFRVATRVSNGTLDYAPVENDDGAAWPAINGIDGELRFERAAMTIDAQRGSVYGVKLADVKVRIDDLNASDPRLKIDGQGAGPLADMVRFVNDSPLDARLDGFLRPARVSGEARLRLQLEIPLHQVRATRVRGGIDFAGNNVALDSGIPALRGVTGRLEFGERTMQLVGISASVLDGSARIDGATRPDGAIEINVRGNTAIGAVRTLVEAPLV